MANNPTANQSPPTPPGDITAFLRADASAADGEADARPAPEAASGASRAGDGVIRDMQKSLVERIADVDDDRRRTAVQLQKALNNHRDETAAGLRRQRAALSFVLALWVLLFAAGLVGLTWQTERRERAMNAALAALEARVATLTAATEVQPPAAALAAEQAVLADLGARLEQVAAVTAELGTAVADLRETRTAPATPVAGAAPTPEPAPAPDRAAEFAAQRAALRAELLAELADAPPNDAQVAATAAALEPRLREAAASAAREALAAELAARDAASVPIGMPIDELIDRQVSRLERDYQRLAQSVDSPALVPAPVPGGASATADPGRLIVAESVGPGAAEPAPAAAADPGTEPGAEPGAEPAAAPAAGDAEQPASAGPTIRVGGRGYALQLIGFHSRAELNAFRAGHALPAETYTREEQFRGRPWHVLIHSLYPDLTSATAALGDLPPDLAGLDVWVRNLPPDAVLEVLGPP